MRSFIYILFLLFSSSFECLYTQSSDYTKECEKYLQLPFISDGHDYSIDLNRDAKGEFKTTFYGGSTYRVITCSNLTQGKVIFTIYDTDKNRLFSNKDFNYTPYWDFVFRSTIDCIIEVKLESKTVKSAQVKLIIGFKNQ